MRGAEGAYARGGGGRAGGEIDSIRRAEEVSDARSFPAGEVSDARRYPAGEVYQTRGGIPRGRYQTRGAEGAYGTGGGGTEDSIRRAEEVSDAHRYPAGEVSDARRGIPRRYQTRGGIS